MLKKSTPLPHGCWCSPMTVYPSNWHTKRASTKVRWYFSYRFYDPVYKDDPKYKDKKGKFIGKQKRVAAMNQFDDLELRQKATEILLAEEMHELQEQGYNLITKQYNPPPERAVMEISEYTPFMEAMWLAYGKMQKSHQCMQVVKSILRHTEIAAKHLNLLNTPISSIKRKHMRMVLEKLGTLSNKWGPGQFNRYKAHLSMVFNELLEFEAIEANPVFFIKKQPAIAKITEALSIDQRHRIDRHLQKMGKTQTTFRLFLRIYYHGGARLQELLALKVSKVNLKEQYFIVTIRKGRINKEVKKTITNNSLRYWKLALINGQPDDYVFSNGLIPGSTRIDRKSVSMRWKRNVKEDLGITADLRSLRHSRSTETAALHGPEAAAAQNSHTSTAMVIKIYDVKAQERNHEVLKQVALTF